MVGWLFIFVSPIQKSRNYGCPVDLLASVWGRRSGFDLADRLFVVRASIDFALRTQGCLCRPACQNPPKKPVFAGSFDGDSSLVIV
jgi:hypothetical protein